MVKISRQPLQAVGDQFLQTADILIVFGKDAYGFGLGCQVRCPGSPKSRLRQLVPICQLLQELGLHLQGFFQPALYGLAVKIGIGDGDKEIPRHQMIDLPCHLLPLSPQAGSHGRQPLGHIDEQILHSRHLGSLAADPHHSAALAACRFLTLKAKHLIFHA